MKALYIFVGANGAGKTSLYTSYKEHFDSLPFVNADELLKEVTGNNDPSNAKFGQDLAKAKMEECFDEGKSFVFETVFSHESKIDLVIRAKELGYMVAIYFCHVGDSALNVARVKKRTELGGHDVPEDKILKRIPRTLENVRRAFSLVDSFFVFDNSSAVGHRLVAYKEIASSIIINSNAPAWAKNLTRIDKSPASKSKQAVSPLMPNRGLGQTRSKERILYKACVRCGRFLRGKVRPHHGVCSICEPKLNSSAYRKAAIASI